MSEFTINLYTRSFPAEITTVQESGKKFSEFFLIYSGSISIQIGKAPPVLVLPESSNFGDYQLFFDLKSIFKYRTHH